MTTVARAPERREPIAAVEVLVAGAAAGLVGGAAMMIFLMLDLGGLGLGFLAPYSYIAATLVGPTALVGGAGMIVLGAAIHVLVSMALGVIYAALVPRDMGGGPAVSWGLGAGVIIALVMSFVILPWADPTLDERIRFFKVSWGFAHVLYGIGLALVPMLRRAIAQPQAR